MHAWPTIFGLLPNTKPPVVITALGSPKPVMETVKAYGRGSCFADVVNLKTRAQKPPKRASMAWRASAAGAGGHTGHLSPFAFISAVREFFDGYIIVGGGP
jgi:nitronate monooxygenase